ncbi:MAG: bifunctional UDP-N-acetylglucosamine diphosphorylase/glucosamine-1-phosphate N-acetyltransferase GlmU [Actinobacteria bacterium]|nr:MAG: bifunctional UDP-N-acetylglucosamine diphosphorylase/glucosamine-1-phosphate N-acetyltransferase GlmU [Actinomycetota bacterium]
METVALVLAAGEGTRMKSESPKVLHQLLDRPMLAYVLGAVEEAEITRTTVVIGHGANSVREYLGDRAGHVVQEQQLGTGHAVMAARDALSGVAGTLFVVSGDTPLLRSETIANLLEEHESHSAAATILTSIPPDPTGYGRIVRDEEGHVARIVEHRDAGPEELEICETNSSIYCFDAPRLFSALERLDRANVQGEYYLTDVIGIMATDGETIASHLAKDFTETLGINSRRQLAEALSVLQARVNERWMDEGVSIMDPAQTWIGIDVDLDRDVQLLPQTYLLGSTSVGSGTTVGPNVRVIDSRIGRDCLIEQAHIRGSAIEDGVNVGPFCSLRPGTVLRSGSKAGTFVEMKKTEVGEGSKVPHLSYMGDATIGRDANVGAGTITCNYDGVRKYPTEIGDKAFIGSDTMLVAPVRVGEGAVTGAGSAITKDVPPEGLGIERASQKNIEGWAKRRRGGKDERTSET